MASHALTRLSCARVWDRRGPRLVALTTAALAFLVCPALAQAPVPQGVEFQVNTRTANDQRNPSIATDADGNFVVVWESRNEPELLSDVYGQRFTAEGVRVGEEFQVNSRTSYWEGIPSVAMTPTGGFVVAWLSNGPDWAGRGIYVRRYSASGTALGTEVLVNTYRSSYHNAPSVGVNADGDFVVAWHSFQDGSSDGVYAQRYNTAGDRVGVEFQVNEFTSTQQGYPSVMVGPSKAFVIVWTSNGGQDGSGSGIYMRRYNAAGDRVGGEDRVNTNVRGGQAYSSAAMDAGGAFVVAWTSYGGQDGSDAGVYAQQYSATGTPEGSEFRVNTHTISDQSYPAVAMDAVGRFVVAWTSAGQDGSANGVFAQQYTATGIAEGGEFRVNTYIQDIQANPSVGAAAGNVVVAWQSGAEVGDGQDGSGDGVFAQRYLSGGVATDPGVPADLTLSVAPNPVGVSGAVVRFLPAPGLVRLTVSDVLGREMAVLLNGEAHAAERSVRVDTSTWPQGVYLVRLENGARVTSLRLVVSN